MYVNWTAYLRKDMQCMSMWKSAVTPSAGAENKMLNFFLSRMSPRKLWGPNFTCLDFNHSFILVFVLHVLKLYKIMKEQRWIRLRRHWFIAFIVNCASPSIIEALWGQGSLSVLHNEMSKSASRNIWGALKIFVKWAYLA